MKEQAVSVYQIESINLYQWFHLSKDSQRSHLMLLIALINFQGASLFFGSSRFFVGWWTDRRNRKIANQGKKEVIITVTVADSFSATLILLLKPSSLPVLIEQMAWAVKPGSRFSFWTANRTNAGKVGVYTKEQLKNDDSKAKLALGKKWDMMCGSKFKYYMVFEHKEMEIQGSYMMDKFIEILKNL